MSYTLPPGRWPHQASGYHGVIGAILQGKKRIVLTSPTGGGKTAMMTDLMQWAAEEALQTIMYCNRRMLFQQSAKVFSDAGIDYGFRAAGYKPALLRCHQIAMTPSDHIAVFRKKTRALHNAGLALIDELHCQGGGMIADIVSEHHRSGGAVVGVTATPIDLEGEWDELVVAGTNSELRKCGALVPAYTYCPDFPDLRHIKKYRIGEDLTDKDNAKIMMRPGVFGRVLKHWMRLNPKGLPTILFGPDVAGSLFFAQQFVSAGVRAAHIDSKQIWWKGQFMPSDDETRQKLLEATETGEVQVLCNRFVLREGINLPHIAVGILATVFGSLKTYLQSVGRILRAFPGLSHVTILDHGGNFIRHGSPNSDRVWDLESSSYKLTAMRQEAMREKPELEPIICPRCSQGRLSGPSCPFCGYTCHKHSRQVVQIDGSLRLAEGPMFKKHREVMKDDTQHKWEACYFRAKSQKWDATFREALGLFYAENRYFPPKTLPLMPRTLEDWFNKVRDVPTERLN